MTEDHSGDLIARSSALNFRLDQPRIISDGEESFDRKIPVDASATIGQCFIHVDNTISVAHGRRV